MNAIDGIINRVGRAEERINETNTGHKKMCKQMH